MTACKKQHIKIILFVAFMVVIMLGLAVSVNAEENITVYNRNEEVTLPHGLIYHNEIYYIAIGDLPALGLDVTEVNSTYTITSNDCLGIERKLVLNLYTYSVGTIVRTMTDEEPVKIRSVSGSGTYNCRSTKKIGYSSEADNPFVGSGELMGLGNYIISVNGEMFASTEFIGDMLSHRYSLENGRMDFYTADEGSVIIDAYISLVHGSYAPEGGHDVTIHTAYKRGEGDTVDDFDVLSTVTYTIPENERNIRCFIETPSEKVTDKNIFFIADIGERYAMVCEEYDFLLTGGVRVYGCQKEVKYTLNLELPEVEDCDVPFTLSVRIGNTTQTKQEIIKKGEKSTVLEITGFLPDKNFYATIEFDYHKYKNAVLSDLYALETYYAYDIEKNYIAEYSRTVVCNVGLPEDFAADGDIEIEVKLSKDTPGVSMVEKLEDWNDIRIVTLNNEKRSGKICLYTQADSSKLSYRIIGDVDGLCTYGYFKDIDIITSNIMLSKGIRENVTTEMVLLREKKIPVTVWRPYSLPTDNDIFAEVRFYEIGEEIKTIDFTETPLIPEGEIKAEFEVEVYEDRTYYLNIENIYGDDRLLDYCYYTYPYYSPSQTSHKKPINYSDNRISLELLRCINVSGNIECIDDALDIIVEATCDFLIGDSVTIKTNAKNGVFNLKISEDADEYVLSARTRLGVKSYYVSDGKSTLFEEDATKIPFVYFDDEEVILEYIVQTPTEPIDIYYEISKDAFVLENISDYPAKNISYILAYYDEDNNLLLSETKEIRSMSSGAYTNISVKSNNSYKIKRIKCFAWDKNTLKPMGYVSEIEVNRPYMPDKNMSVFTYGEQTAIINCQSVILDRAPEKINDTMYLSVTDFAKLGYTVQIKNNETIYVEKYRESYRIWVDEMQATDTKYNDKYEISAPVLYTDEILIPVDAISQLFNERVDLYDNDNTLILNVPFRDIYDLGIHTNAILDMYYRGVALGYDDITFRLNEKLMRCTAAAYFARLMGHEIEKCDFYCADVTSFHWAKSAIGICINEGVFELENNRFRPNDYITIRETLVAAMAIKGISTEEYEEYARDNGFLTNIDDTDLDRDITREEMMQLLYNTTAI